ncbi:hypothetical protein ACFLIM_27735 [Nonomuraea sp. M3C6]|uniref:Uncharacterized protein n=1 Tax=Nonomuraea marmarensis TaxID=3351344 RepID=A0ABW7AKL2_9ACTN
MSTCSWGTNTDEGRPRPREFSIEPPGLVIDPDDAIGMRLHPDGFRISGCCGMSYADD